ncbi:MAG: hypothetical protein AAGA22_06080 [Pseudomonadota bacterium]
MAPVSFFVVTNDNIGRDIVTWEKSLTARTRYFGLGLLEGNLPRTVCIPKARYSSVNQ